MKQRSERQYGSFRAGCAPILPASGRLGLSLPLGDRPHPSPAQAVVCKLYLLQNLIQVGFGQEDGFDDLPHLSIG